MYVSNTKEATHGIMLFVATVFVLVVNYSILNKATSSYCNWVHTIPLPPPPQTL